MQNKHCIGFLWCLLIILLAIGISAKDDDPNSHGVTCDSEIFQSVVGLQVISGWYVHRSSVVWGNAQHNGWWRAGQRPNLTRNAQGQIGPNRTEDLEKLTDNMLRYGYPGFEHNFGLWYDRRRDAHDTTQRKDDKVVPPFLEQPWLRSGKGKSWDGLTKYDLTKFNPWYFDRLKEFAELCDRKGTILLFNFYMQHALLETDAHYVDFPWRPTNCIQDTGMPDRNPAANIFYDVSHATRRSLHGLYIRKCLDELGSYKNIILLISEEFTGPASFVEFWLDTIMLWEHQNHRDVHIAVSGCKNVIDAILAVPQYRDAASSIDLRYWWYQPDGSLFAPTGGTQVPGRYVTRGAAQTTPQQNYRQIKEYRLKHPSKGILQQMEASRQQSWAFLMGGGSLLIRYLSYPGQRDPRTYIGPADSVIILPLYKFIREYLADSLYYTQPLDVVFDHPEYNWCLAWKNNLYLIYALKGGSFRLDLTEADGIFKARWLDPRTGKLQTADNGRIKAGRIVTFTAPNEDDWALWLTK
jgi:hypothetical protein